ncbi:MAG: lincosamide nucleotidyltransferase Lnu(F) [Anaerolineae bacterium]|nr:lincosamide nucleotidyltransferase Lnu(F) [Anaerolineae bacterium]
MLPQEELIARVRTLCQEDSRVDAAMMYGSFTRGEGDVYSDVEFILFFDDERFDNLDHRAWLGQIAPVHMLYVNEHGITVVIFENLIRGEFHFHPASDVIIGEAWNGLIAFPSLDATLIVDRSGALTPYLLPLLQPIDRLVPERMQNAVNNFVNWHWFGFNVLRRGEHARALEILTMVHRDLLWMARALENNTTHWLTPSKALEQELSADAYARFQKCTAPLDDGALQRAYQHAWQWGMEMIEELHAQFGATMPARLRHQLAERVLGEVEV